MSKQEKHRGLRLGDAKEVADREDVGQVIELDDEAGEPILYGDGKRSTVTVAGRYSHRYRNAVKRQTIGFRKGKMKSFSEDDLLASAIEIEAACVLSWEGIETDDGGPIDCNPKNVAAFLAGIPWFREAVQAAIEDHAGFFGNA